MTNQQRLDALNSYRAAAGLDPIKSWKAARHQQQLNDYDQAQGERLAAEQLAVSLPSANDGGGALGKSDAELPAVADAVKAAKAKEIEGNANPAKATAPKPLTKKAPVLDLLSAKGGTTIAAIAASLAISDTAARSLIGDLRRDGATIKADKGKDNVVVYTTA